MIDVQATLNHDHRTTGIEIQPSSTGLVFVKVMIMIMEMLVVVVHVRVVLQRLQQVQKTHLWDARRPRERLDVLRS